MARRLSCNRLVAAYKVTNTIFSNRGWGLNIGEYVCPRVFRLLQSGAIPTKFKGPLSRKLEIESPIPKQFWGLTREVISLHRSIGAEYYTS